MSFSLAQSTIASANATSVAASFTTTAPTVGNLMVVGVISFNASPTSVADNFGNGSGSVYPLIVSNANNVHAALYAVVVASTGTPFTVTANFASGTIATIAPLEFAPSGTTSGDGSNSNVSSGTALSTGAFTTTGSSDLVVAVGGQFANGVTWTHGTGFTIAQSAAGSSGAAASLAIEYQLNVAAGSINPALTSGTSANWAIAGAAWKATGASVVVPYWHLFRGSNSGLMDTP